MVVAITLGALMWSVPELTAILVPLTTLQTAFVSARHRHGVDWGLLLRWILPLMGIGMVASLGLVGADDHGWLRPVLGVVVLVGALRELGRGAGPPPGPVASGIAMVGAGVMHGIYAIGGPLLVWALGRSGLDKARFRATLHVVWLVLNGVLITVYVARGQLTEASLIPTGLLVVPMVLGIAAGEWLHHRVDEVRFRGVVWVALGIAAIPLIVG